MPSCSGLMASPAICNFTASPIFSRTLLLLLIPPEQMAYYMDPAVAPFIVRPGLLLESIPTAFKSRRAEHSRLKQTKLYGYGFVRIGIKKGRSVKKGHSSKRDSKKPIATKRKPPKLKQTLLKQAAHISLWRNYIADFVSPKLDCNKPNCETCGFDHWRGRQSSLCEYGFVPTEGLDHTPGACPVNHRSDHPLAYPKVQAMNPGYDQTEYEEYDWSKLNDEIYQERYYLPTDDKSIDVRMRGWACDPAVEIILRKFRLCNYLCKGTNSWKYPTQKQKRRLERVTKGQQPFGFFPFDHFVHQAFMAARPQGRGLKNLRSLELRNGESVQSLRARRNSSLEQLPPEIQTIILDYMLEDPSPTSRIALQSLYT
ncbi:hypothetical protein BT63DRAFT_435267, partial [Microthyrium microscopicum]